MSPTMPLAELLPGVAVPAGLVISGLVQDSRAVTPGDAFVAIEAASGDPAAHGLAFAEAARAAGASAILFEPPAPVRWPAPTDAIAVPALRAQLGAIADRFHQHPSRAMTCVGVTGTNGKTSTVQLLVQAWVSAGLRAGSIGTLGAGLHGEVQPTGFTTPQVAQLHALLGQLRDAGARAVAMEVSSHALAQGRVDGVRFEVAVFTNLSRDHLDYHGDMQAYADAKRKLFDWPGLRAAVINLDDASGRELHAQLPHGIEAVGVSVGRDGAVQARDVVLDAGGIAFALQIGAARHPVRSALVGRFNVDNLLAVAGVLHALGEPADAIAATLSTLQPVPGRMNRLGGGRGQPLVVIDYAHTPDALEQALTSLRAHLQGRLICVFGCGGERDTGKRPQMGAIAERLADLAIVTDDNPRGEDGDAIVADILQGFARPQFAQVQRDRAAAIRRAVGEAGASDIVLVAGKGHEPYQEVAGIQHPFDDALVAQQALQERAA